MQHCVDDSKAITLQDTQEHSTVYTHAGTNSSNQTFTTSWFQTANVNTTYIHKNLTGEYVQYYDTKIDAFVP